MSNAERLRATVAEFFGVPESQVDHEFVLPGSSDSVARATLDALIRRQVGRASQAVYRARTYGEIESELFPNASWAPESSPSTKISPPQTAVPRPGVDTLAVPVAVSCGVDMELIGNLPPADDHWESPFYRTVFSPSEIADCLRRETPELHFAARWCVKEALKKCDRQFLSEDMNRIELIADETGAPYLLHHANGSSRRLPHAVSLSHTPNAAVAVVVSINIPQIPTAEPRPASPFAVLPSSPLPLPREPTGRSLTTICLLLTLTGLVLSALALYRSSGFGG